MTNKMTVAINCLQNYWLSLQKLVFFTHNKRYQQKLIFKPLFSSKMGNCLKKNQVNVNASQTNQIKLVKTPEEKGLSLVIKCWKETHNNLFNFNLPDSQLSSQVVNVMLKKIRIAKLGDQYQALLPKDPQFSKIMPPIMIDVNQTKEKDKFGSKKYTFLINEFPRISRPFWLVVKSLPNQRYLLKQGDIFKMGKIKIRVKQIIHKNSETKDMNKQIVETQYKVYDCQANNCQGKSNFNDLKCRICMEEGQNTNPLIGICDCIGSSKYAHFKCLRQWFTIQLDPTKINMVTQINWKSLQCELCKAKLPYSINIDNENYFLVQFPKIKKPYLVLNPVYKSNNEKSKIYYFISFKKRNRMIIGRKSDADIQLCTDVTISRHHSVIEYVQKNPNENGKFYLEDNRSKFGTVVLLNSKTCINVDPKLNGVQFQVGGDVIKISYKTQNFFQTITTKQDEIDFNAGQTQFQTREFQDEGDDQINNVGSQEQDKKESAKQENRMLNSEDSHQQTNQILLPSDKKPLQKKLNKT